MTHALTLQGIEDARRLLGERVLVTPVQEWEGPSRAEFLGPRARVFLKLELFQRTGSFKARGALLNMLSLSTEQLARGVAAISAGNHAVAVAYAAQVLGTSAHLVIIKTANPWRVELCRRYGAEIELAENAHAGFERAAQVERDEGRALIHPYEGVRVATGTATLGLELCRQVESLDAVIIPIGGGGLCAGVASAVKLIQPRCRVYGVEPEGADSMHRSFAAGEPRGIERVATIADSLGAPYATPISFELCRRNVDALALVTDAQLREAMRLMQRECKLAVEPAGAAALAALLGPLRTELADRRVALIVSGSNIDSATYARLLEVS
ncbi:MAG TPA: pyridoxal-phosphate dependent enzyme [Steroidobacteraceae bacterium]|nr:pyridoxal-phosphate dependent enzyme [Steroidobacteraceae bacterium]